MKQLTCKMCGSNDLVKQDGVFVCQNCGCKYSVEEAKKMNEIIKDLRNEFNKRKNDLQEPNIKVHIVTNTFLKYLGYDTDKCIYEAPTGKGYCDILVPTNGDNALVVEVKTGKQPLNEKDIEQIQDYANRKKTEIWHTD